MSILPKLASQQNIRNDVPNQELAKELAASNNKKAIQELADNLWNKDKNIQSDCVKTLYETAYIKPDLLKDYAADFIKLIQSNNNRLVWGAMIALSTIAELAASELHKHRAIIIKTIESGSVITVDAGIKALAIVAAQKSAYNTALFPYLLQHLETCRPKDVAQHAECTVVAVNKNNKQNFIAVLEKRLPHVSASQEKRVRKVLQASNTI